MLHLTCRHASTVAAELSTAALPPTNVSSALALLDLLSASRPSFDQDTGATMIDAVHSLSSPLTSSQAVTALRIAGRLANRTIELTEEMGGTLLQITDQILTGRPHSEATARVCRYYSDDSAACRMHVLQRQAHQPIRSSALPLGALCVPSLLKRQRRSPLVERIWTTRPMGQVRKLR